MGIIPSWAHCKQLALITELELASIFSLFTSQLQVLYVTLGYHSLAALVIIYLPIMVYFPWSTGNYIPPHHGVFSLGYRR